MFTKKLKKSLGTFFLTGILLCPGNIVFAHIINIWLKGYQTETSNMSTPSQSEAPEVIYTIEINGAEYILHSIQSCLALNINNEFRNIRIGKITATLKGDLAYRKELVVRGLSRHYGVKDRFETIDGLIILYAGDAIGGRQIIIHDSDNISLDDINAPKKEGIEISISIKAPAISSFYTDPFEVTVEAMTILDILYEKTTNTKETFGMVKSKER